jgi:serine protease Do
MHVAALALAIGGVLSPAHAAEPVRSVAPGVPPQPGFSAALRQALPSVVGVYGVGVPPEAVELSSQAAPSVARMKGQQRAPWSTPSAPTSIGAGFFIDDAGTVVTAAHVVADARQILVKTADLRVFVAQLVDQDDETDIALLRVPSEGVPAPLIGRSAASRPGDWVLAVGEPFGLKGSVVAGIVAGRTRHFAEDSEGMFIQSDLALNPGNSGGPLLNASGAIIGMNLRTVVGPFGTAGVSLSIPIETVLQIAGELKTGTTRLRPRLGAGFEDVSVTAALEAGRSYATGALVTRVDDGSAARRLGLKEGDIVVGMNGHAIEDSADLARWLMAWRSLPGTRLVVWREGRYQQLAVR